MTRNSWLKLAAVGAATLAGGGVAALAAWPVVQAAAAVAGVALGAVATLYADKPKRRPRRKPGDNQIDDEEDPAP